MRISYLDKIKYCHIGTHFVPPHFAFSPMYSNPTSWVLIFLDFFFYNLLSRIIAVHNHTHVGHLLEHRKSINANKLKTKGN